MASFENRIICGDALAVLRTLPADCIQTCCTSPPYYRQRDYGVDGQIGQEATPDEYVDRLAEVFSEVKRVLYPQGTLWLNIADCYASFVPKSWPAGIKTKDMLGLPWSLAFALRNDGWYLRSDIIWNKTNAFPNSNTDRPVSSYEHVFLLSKSTKYFFDYKVLEVPVADSTKVRMRHKFNTNKYMDGAPGQTAQALNQPRPRSKDQKYRRGRDVWDIGTNSRVCTHFAPFPMELAQRCIMAGSLPGDVILDPFIGSGTTGMAAKMLGRKYIGIDISPESCRVAEERISEVG